MKLKYNILWFEDEEEVVEEDIGDDIRRFLKSIGFEPIIQHEKDGKNLDSLLKKNYDLIVSDLNLGQHETGNKLVESIRKQSIFTEVLLYSAATSDIIKIIEENGRMIERISFAVGLGELRTKLKNIISLTVKKVQDVNNMRGLVIAETIDLELELEDIIIKYFKLLPGQKMDEFRRKILQKICKNKINSCEDNLENAKKSYDQDIDVLISHDILTIYDLYMALNSILKSHIANINIEINSKTIAKDKKDELESYKNELMDLREELAKFNEDIIKLRNTLAHVQEKLNEEGVPYLESLNKNGTKIVFDDEKYNEVRRNLLRHNQNLSKIKKYLLSLPLTGEEVAIGRENI